MHCLNGLNSLSLWQKGWIRIKQRLLYDTKSYASLFLPELIWAMISHWLKGWIQCKSWGGSLINTTSCCWKLFSQWQCSFHLKAALPLAKKLQVNSHQFRLQVDSHQYSKAKPRVDFIMNRYNEYTWRLCLCHEWSVFGLRDIYLFDVCVEHVARWQMDVIRKRLLCPY